MTEPAVFTNDLRLPLHPYLRAILIVAAYVAAHIVLDRLSYIAPVAPFAITPWNPTSGLSIAFLLIYGLRYWPALPLAALAAEIVLRSLPETMTYTVLNVAVGAGGYVAAAVLLRMKLPGGAILTRRHLGWLVLAATVFALPVAASHVATLTLSGMLPAADFAANLAVFWVGDVIGIVITTPVLLLAHGAITGGWRPVRLAPGRAREMALQAAILGAVLAAVFGLPYVDEARFFYLLFIPLIWISVRQGFVGAVAAIVCIQLTLVVWAYVLDKGAIPVAELQALMLALAITGFFLGMAISEHRDALNALHAREEELQSALRAAAATEMYSALAHELHQPLAAASHFAWAGRKLLDTPGHDVAELRDVLEKTLSEARRAGAVTQRLRDLYLGEVSRREPVDVNAILDEAVRSLQARCVRHGVILRAAGPDAAVVLADAVQVAMVARNVIANAVDAIVGAGAGWPAARRVIAVEVVRAEGMAIVTVDDGGPGLAAGFEDRVFAAFATTKERGLGLGLAISRSIVEAHGGRIWLGPSRLGGACFCFSLPFENHGSHGRSSHNIHHR
jgi:two-component system sensor kinase FixL